MLHCQITWSICDYSFSDSEVYTFLLPSELADNFVSLYNKDIEQIGDVHQLLETIGVSTLPESYGFIEILKNDNDTISLEEYSNSENNMYLLSISYRSFSNSYQNESILKSPVLLSKELIEKWVNSYNQDLIKLKKESQEAAQKWLKQVSTPDTEKTIQKKIDSLKGKKKKNSEEYKDSIREKVVKEHNEKLLALKEISANKNKELQELIEDDFVGYILKKENLEKVIIDLEFESNDSNGIIE